MPVRVVVSKQNARLKELRRALAAPGRGARGLVGIEGPKILEEALSAGLRIVTVFVAQGAEGLLDALHAAPEPKFCVYPGNCSTPRWPPRLRSPSPRWLSRPIGPGRTSLAAGKMQRPW